MSPEVLEMILVPADAVPPQPIKRPMWFPVLVIVPDTSVPSTSMFPLVVEMLAGFSISIPVLCEVRPTLEESWPLKTTSPAPAEIEPIKRIPEYAKLLAELMLAVAFA
jgi:hypothetical protein